MSANTRNQNLKSHMLRRGEIAVGYIWLQLKEKLILRIEGFFFRLVFLPYAVFG